MLVRPRLRPYQLVVIRRDQLPREICTALLPWDKADPPARRQRWEAALRTALAQGAYAHHQVHAQNFADLSYRWNSGRRPPGAETERRLYPGDLVADGVKGHRPRCWWVVAIGGFCTLNWVPDLSSVPAAASRREGEDAHAG